jgi:hypothetical protein
VENQECLYYQLENLKKENKNLKEITIEIEEKIDVSNNDNQQALEALSVKMEKIIENANIMEKRMESFNKEFKKIILRGNLSLG